MKTTNEMKIKQQHQSTSYTFSVEHKEKQYKAEIWMNESSSKFQDWEITDNNGDKVDSDLEDEIIEYIDKNWDKL
jgi:outer membrane lipoprotein-sorting protein